MPTSRGSRQQRAGCERDGRALFYSPKYKHKIVAGMLAMLMLRG
jgi:hypothetical protein